MATPTHAVWASDPAWAHPADGAAVSSWRNQSGGGDPAAAGSARPTFRLSTAAFNGRSTVQFDGVANVLDFNIADIAQPFKVLAVFSNLAGADGTGQRFLGAGGSSANGIGKNTSNQWQLQYDGSAGAGAVNTSPHVFRATINGASSVLFVDEASVIAADGGAGAQKRLTIGAGADDTPAFARFWNGHGAFLGIYPSTTADAALIAAARGFGRLYGIAVA